MDFKDDERALEFILDNDEEGLNSIESYHPRIIIEELKNDPPNLEWFFEYVVKKKYILPGAGSYHYTYITDNKIFDLYKKYNFGGNCHKSCMTKEQWDYLLEIDYITKEEHDDESA